mmetsp:Transcript_43004/g.91446  ORF Transcript_43004/g.91446 Transcript_43004/m.91446 type:complete len:363 (+) Transcript_43004:336-1424(+)
MLPPTPLRLMLRALPPHPRVTELLHQRPVDPIAKLLHGRVALRVQYDRLVVIRYLSLGLGVYPHHVAPGPYLLHELLQIPLVLRRDGDVVGHLIQDVQFLDGERVDFVENVQHRDVRPVALDDVDELIDRDVLPQYDLGAADFELLQHHAAHVGVHPLGLGHHLLVVYPARLLFGDAHVGGTLVDPYAEGEELLLDDLFVREGLAGIEDDEDQVAGAGGGDDLSSPTLSLSSALDDPRKIQHLNSGALVLHRPRYASQRRELVRRRLAPRPRERRQQRALPHGRKSHQSHPGVSRLGHVEPTSGVLGTCGLPPRSVEELGSQFSELGLERAQVVVRGLVLLGPGHLGLDFLDLLLHVGHDGK